MLQRARGLTHEDLEAIRRLEASTIENDGGRLKLEWGALRTRPGDRVDDLLWWEGDRLVGFAGLYQFGSPVVEVTGMVEPTARRRGIGARLLDESVALCRERNAGRFLLVTPRTSDAARHLATSRGGVLEHSEHALVLTGGVEDGASDPSIALRPASGADAGAVGRLLTSAFGHPWEPVDLEAPGEPTYVAERDGAVIATLRVHKGAQDWGVYGFAVEPSLQGRGIGRGLLRRVCREAFDAGMTQVHLEVSVDNDRALGLYTSLGFTLEATEDYYELTL